MLFRSENNTLDEYSQAAQIIRNFMNLGPVARSMVVGGLREIRGEDILGGGGDDEDGGEKKVKSGKVSLKGKPKEVVKPEKVSSEPSGKLTVTIKKFSSEYNDSYLAASLTITNSSPGSYWLSKSGNVVDEWIVYDFGKKEKVTKVALLASSSYNINPKDITVQIAKDKDGNEWVDWCKLEMENGTTAQDKWQVFEIGNCNTTLIKLLFHNRHGDSGGNCFLVSAVRFY